MIFTEIRLRLAMFSFMNIQSNNAWETGKARCNSKNLIWPVAVMSEYSHVMNSDLKRL